MVRIVRRTLLRAGVVLLVVAFLAAAAIAYAAYVEPYWLKVRTVRLSKVPTVRLVHISDIHYKGDRAFLERVVKTINVIPADAVCFTGDLLEEPEFEEEALRLLSAINKPLYGIPGNHDCWALRSFEKEQEVFERTGGAWLTDTGVRLASNDVELVTVRSALRIGSTGAATRILLEHDPDVLRTVDLGAFDLILSGHTHGGQVRFPVLETLLFPYDVGPYDRGLFRTQAGPLYVNPGLGTYYLTMRFLCRPEITVMEL